MTARYEDAPSVPQIEYRQRGLTAQQITVLLQPLIPARVHRVEGQSYLPQQDVRAHLTRLFGFTGWSMEVVETALVHQAPTLRPDKKTGKRNPERIDACWRATVRLTIRDQHGNELARYEDAATGDAQNSEPIAAHDLALKSAVSTALKRAATCLGDQFGLSLYNKGSMSQFVGPFVFTPTIPGGAGVSANVAAATEEQDPDVRPQAAEPGTDVALRDEHDRQADAVPMSQERPSGSVDDPEHLAQRAITQAHQRRQERDSKRHGDATANAKGRLWDAFTEATDGAGVPQGERMAALNAECQRRGWDSVSLLHPDRLTVLAADYEQQADDRIMAHFINPNQEA